MATKAIEDTAPRMSDAAVKEKTGKTWKEWFAILDKAGARKMNHQEIVKYLNTKHSVGPWWQQMVTVTYEQARGLREKHQKPEGYQISVSRTIRTPLAKLFKSFANENARKAWLPEDGLTTRKATPNKSIRIGWNDGKSSLEIYFSSKDDDKSQVVVQHSKLPDAKASAKMKAYWAKALIDCVKRWKSKNANTGTAGAAGSPAGQPRWGAGSPASWNATLSELLDLVVT